MYLRVCSIAGEPAGRGPMATIWRKCSHARLESNFGVACPDTTIAKMTINAETAEPAERIGLLCGFCEFWVDLFLMIAWRGERNPVEQVQCRSVGGARSSAPNRAASLPTAPPSPRCEGSQTDPETPRRESLSPDK